MPYREGKAQVGKQNTLFYALLIAGFMVFQSMDIKFGKDWSAQSKDIDTNTLVICTSALLLLLGINIKDELFAIAVIVSRNTALINILAAKNNIPPEELEAEIKQLPEDSNSKNHD